MQLGEIGYLVLLGLVFAIWAFVWFRALFGLKRIADQRRGTRVSAILPAWGSQSRSLAGFCGSLPTGQDDARCCSGRLFFLR